MQPAYLDGLSFNESFGLHSPFFGRISKELTRYLAKKTKEVSISRKAWEDFFGKIHRKEDTTDDLFIKHTYLFLLVEVVLYRRFFSSGPNEFQQNLGFLRQNLGDRDIALNGSEFYSWGEAIPEVCEALVNALQKVEFARGDLFYAIYQGLTSPAARHALGEFYTPPSLVNLMLEKSYNTGMSVLDPACGSGAFLVEMIVRSIKSTSHSPKSVAAIENLYGFDVHPLAVLVTKANVLLQFEKLPAGKVSLQIYQIDALFPDPEVLHSIHPVAGFDLVIGNPPWLVLNGIESEVYKEKLKDLARQLGIMQGGKFATHTEMTALFYYRCRDLFLKDSGWIFFVATAGFLSGDQHARFRQFKGFGNPFAWRFDQDIFRVHNICLGLQKLNQNLQDRLRVKVTDFQCRESGGIWAFIPQMEQFYIPYNLQEIRSEEDPVRRLIPENELGSMLPRGASPYFGKFYQGASLVPRTLIFVVVEKEENGIVTVAPDMNVQAKPPWDFQPYQHAQVEQEYIHPVAKSTEIVPFKLVSIKIAFIPADTTHLKPLARTHFAFLGALYKERQKRGATITDLWTRLDYNHGLATSRQDQGRKVIFRGIGGYTQAAIVGREVIVDTSCYFYPAESEGEAYYLLAVLNSLKVSQDLQKRGSTGASGSLRNLHKKPLEYNIPLYDKNNPTHAKLAELGSAMETKVNKLIEEWHLTELHRAQKQAESLSRKKTRASHEIVLQDIALRPHTIHNLILKNLAKDFEELDIYVITLLTASS